MPVLHIPLEFGFRELEKLLSTKYYTVKLLPIKSRSQIFVPMIEVLDNLLVMGVVQSETDIQRLLALLSPERLVPSNQTGLKKVYKAYAESLHGDM